MESKDKYMHPVIPEKYKEYIEIAMREAKIAFNNGEVPVGSVIIENDKIISKGHNLVENSGNITLHSEIVSIKKATKKKKTIKLDNCTILTTLEPCPMCLSALIYSHIEKIIFLAEDKKWGALGGLYDLRTFIKNHKIPTFEFIEYKPAEDLIEQFFKKLRNRNNNL